MKQDTVLRRHVKKIFDEALEKDPAERAVFLDSACEGEPEIRARVERLLEMIDDDPGFLEEPPRATDFGAEDLTALDGDGDLAGQRIGHYHLRRVIAGGGMGTVYEAVQDKPHRTVAVKIMKQGIASRSALRRFEYESQILARLRHPGIAQVFEAGTCDIAGGVPYFVMEYVPNAMHITEYTREKKLTTRQRLELFSQVCEAVHHGHQRGIIHRDLKPANILIDSSGQPKIIDFGVARATDSDMTVTTLQTNVGQLIGTIQYMSPEQCLADPHDLDTRSDVYALGVVLYELLCDQLPYDVTHAAIHEAIRVVREQEPARPSTVSRALRGDVETIVLKALQKDRERRYSSAGDLASDISRYLKSEAIEARPPSATYQLRKFAQRHKGLAVGIAAVFIVLAGASIVSTVLYLKAEEAREKAQLQAAIAEAVNTFLNVDLLAAVAPSEEQGRGKDVLMRDVLDEAAKRIEDASVVGGRFEGKPLVEASIRLTLGWTYRELGEYPAAEPHLERARLLRRRELGGEHPDTLTTMQHLGWLYKLQGRYEEAEMLIRETLEIRKRVLGEEHLRTLVGMNDLAAVYVEQGRYDDAELLRLQTLEMQKRVLGEEHPETLMSMSNLAILYQGQGRYREAERLCAQTLEMQERVLGEEHPDTLRSMTNLAAAYAIQGREEKAEPLLVKTLEIHRRVLGEEHPVTLSSMSAVAVVYMRVSRFEEAEPLYVQALDIQRRVLGEDHPETLGTMLSLATMYSIQGRYDESEPLFIETLESRRRILGEEHPHTLDAMHNLAVLYADQGRYEQAEPLYVKTLEIERRVLGGEHFSTLMTMSNLAETYANQQRFDEAETLWLEAIEIMTRLGGGASLTLYCKEDLATIYLIQGRLDEAEPLVRDLLDIRRKRAERTDASAEDKNNCAWELLTCEPAELRDPETALHLAVEANEMTGHGNPAYLDTLSLAYHLTGDTAKAIQNQKKALAMLPPGESSDRTAVEAALAEFEAALDKESAQQPVEQEAVASGEASPVEDKQDDRP